MNKNDIVRFHVVIRTYVTANPVPKSNPNFITYHMKSYDLLRNCERKAMLECTFKGKLHHETNLLMFLLFSAVYSLFP